MRVMNAPTVRPAPLRAMRTQRRGVSDSRALLFSILGGLLLACYVHDPVTVESQLRQGRSTVNQVSTWFTPSHFQAALVNMTK